MKIRKKMGEIAEAIGLGIPPLKKGGSDLMVIKKVGEMDQPFMPARTPKAKVVVGDEEDPFAEMNDYQKKRKAAVIAPMRMK